jgi:hypothetical protein
VSVMVMAPPGTLSFIVTSSLLHLPLCLVGSCL